MFWHPAREICTIVHGDDYVLIGHDQDLLWLEEELLKAYKIKTQKLGLNEGWERQGKALNRIVSCVDDGWTIEDTVRIGSTPRGFYCRAARG